MHETYDPLDRATMATWKASKTLGWSAAALGVALVLHTVFDEISRRVHVPGVFGTLNQRPFAFFSTWQSVAPMFGYRAFVAIVVGLTVGIIAGLKIHGPAAKAAALVALAYAGVTGFVLERSLHLVPATGGSSSSGIHSGTAVSQHGFPAGGREWLYALLGLFAVAAATPIATRVAKRRTARDGSA